MITRLSATNQRQKQESWKDKEITHYNIWDKMRNFDNMSADMQRAVYDYIVGKDEWGRRYHIGELMDKSVFDKEQKFALFNKYLSTGGYDNDDEEIFNKACELDEKRTKEEIKKFKDCHMTRRFVTLASMTKDEEVLALRAMSKSKYAPGYVFNAQYCPTLNAIKQLAPIMRLKSLEALTSNIHVSYNVFSNIDDEEEFKRLLFSSVIRYRDRAEAVWEKYNELKHTGTEGTVIIKYNCANCKDFEFRLTSSVVRTKTKLEATRFGQYLASICCLLCGQWNTMQGPTISGDLEGLDG